MKLAACLPQGTSPGDHASMTQRSSPATGSPQLRLLGDPVLVGANGSIRSLERRAAGLLALVALEPGVTRARAAALLWPESDNARQSLRQQIARFRKNYGAELVRGDDALFIADGVAVDALQTVGGTLLGDLSFDDCEDFAHWLAQQRRQRRNDAVSGIAQQIAEAEAQGDLDAATRLAEQLLLADNDSEAHHRTLIRLHYLRGDIAQAQATYERLARLLRTRFGAQPSAETEQLARALRAAQPAPRGATAFAQPVPVTVLRPPRLIGRARELAELASAWSEGRAALLLGEPGMGKSRLLAEFAQARHVLMVQGRPGDAGVPYATLARLLRLALARCEVAISEAHRLELARVVPELAAGVAPPAAGQRLALQEAFERLLAGARLDAAPLDGLIVDDLHFVDDATLEMLQGLVSSLAATLRFAFAQRPGEGSPAAAALRDALEEGGLLTPLMLSPLSENELGELIASLQIEGLDVQLLAAALARHTGGNPLFALETVKQGLGGGQLRAGRLPQPGSVSTLIERRLKQLSDRALALARVAAIAGPDFTTPLAEHATGERAIVLADAWNELQAAQVLRDTVFAHDLVADAVLRTLPEAIARHLHAEVARWLRAHEGEPARIARHWLDAGHDAEAVDALLEAAARARTAGRMAESGRFLLQAAQACDRSGDSDRAFDLTYRAADALSLAVPIDEFGPIADELERRARTDAHWAAAHLARAHVLIDRGPPQAAAEMLVQGLAAARRAGRRDLEAELTFGQVHILFAAGDLAAACDAMERALRLFREAKMYQREADKLMSLGTLQSMTGRLTDALATFASARERFDALALDYLKPNLLSSWAVHALFAGDGATARQLLTECDALLKERGVSEIGSGHLSQLVKDCLLTWLRLGEPGAALACLEQARMWPRWAQVANDAETRVAVGCLMLELGRPERVGALFEPLLKETGFSTNAALARIASLQLAPDDAAAFWASTPNLAHLFPPVAMQCLAVVLLSEYAPPERALAELARLLADAEAQGWNGARVALLATQAVALSRAGQRQEGCAAAEAADDLGQRYASMCSPLAVALNCAEAFERGGDAVRARACLLRARGLIKAAAAALPNEFRSSYLQRNPLVRAVLEAGSRVDHLTDQRADGFWLRLRQPAALRRRGGR